MEWKRPCFLDFREDGITSFGLSGWKLKMRAVPLSAAALRFFGVFDGVGNMVVGSTVGGASEVEGWSESEAPPFV